MAARPWQWLEALGALSPELPRPNMAGPRICMTLGVPLLRTTSSEFDGSRFATIAKSSPVF